MKKSLLVTVSIVTLLSLTISAQAVAHEFILRPIQLNVPVGHKLPFSVLSAHVFMVSEEVEPVEEVEVSLTDGNGKKEIPLYPNNVLLTLDGSVEIEKEGTRILCGHRKGMIWTKTTRGWKQAGKNGLKGVISSGKYEKFCKTLVTAGQAGDGYRQVVGHRLEIVPVDNPGDAKVGKDLTFQVLFDNKALITEVYATYDGFSMTPNTYAYFTETDGNGTAKVRITQPGTWMVRVQHKVDTSTPDYDQHVMRAVLVFGVN